jgi:hypothetical protein
MVFQKVVMIEDLESKEVLLEGMKTGSMDEDKEGFNVE